MALSEPNIQHPNDMPGIICGLQQMKTEILGENEDAEGSEGSGDESGDEAGSEESDQVILAALAAQPWDWLIPRMCCRLQKMTSHLRHVYAGIK